MNVKTLVLSVVAVSFTYGMSVGAIAADATAPKKQDQPSKEESTGPGTGSAIGAPPEVAAAIDQARLVNDLAAYAESKSDPLAMIVAASVAKSLPGGAAFVSAKSGEKATKVTLSDRLLGRAKELSKDRKDLAPLIADVEAQKSRDITTCWASSPTWSGYWIGPNRYVARTMALNQCRANTPYGMYCHIDSCDD